MTTRIITWTDDETDHGGPNWKLVNQFMQEVYNWHSAPCIREANTGVWNTHAAVISGGEMTAEQAQTVYDKFVSSMEEDRIKIGSKVDGTGTPFPMKGVVIAMDGLNCQVEWKPSKLKTWMSTKSLTIVHE